MPKYIIVAEVADNEGEIRWITKTDDIDDYVRRRNTADVEAYKIIKHHELTEEQEQVAAALSGLRSSIADLRQLSLKSGKDLVTVTDILLDYAEHKPIITSIQHETLAEILEKLQQ